MYLLANIIVLLVLLISLVTCDQYMGEYVYSYELDSFRYDPTLGACFEVYNQDEKVTPFTCRKKINRLKQSCTEWIPGDTHCLGIKTPTGEVVELICFDEPEKINNFHPKSDLKSCFNVYKPGRDTINVCQKLFDKYSIGITTPDNFTILLDSYFCSPFITASEKEASEDFMQNFKFDPELRSCYKVYREDQEVTPYSCLNKDVHDSCVLQLPEYKNCMGIMTPNNETVILSCPDETLSPNEPGCFTVYGPNNEVSTRCQEKLEERCVGITTPSNLTVLFECYFCTTGDLTEYYSTYNQKKHRNFVKTYIADEYLGSNTYLDKIQFGVFGPKEVVKPTDCNFERTLAHGYWLPDGKCYGVTLNNNETVILECLDSTQEERGCFKVSSPGDVVTTVCLRPLGERCVGITTPKDISVAFACYSEYDCYAGKKHHAKPNPNKITVKSLPDITSRQIWPDLHECYHIYGPGEEIVSDLCRRRAQPEKYSCVDWLPSDQNCLGLKFPSGETIEFVCGSSKEDALSYEAGDRIGNCFNMSRSDGKVEKICQKIIGSNSVGITTPSNYTMLFKTEHCITSKNPRELQKFRDFVQNFRFDPNVRTCYKVYTQDQEISPTSCLSDEIHESCVHQLKQEPDCEGITTQNGETIVLDCPGNDKKQNEPGCFKIYTANNAVVKRCQEQVEESCMGFKTPSNLTVLLECLECISLNGEYLRSYTDDFRKTFKGFVKKVMDPFTAGVQVNLEHRPFFNIYKPDQGVKETDCYSRLARYPVHVLHGNENCLGVTTEKLETVVLNCPHKQLEKPGCFDVYGPSYGPDSKIIGPPRKIKSACVEVIKERCVGLKLPSNWTLPLDCATPRFLVC